MADKRSPDSFSGADSNSVPPSSAPRSSASTPQSQSARRDDAAAPGSTFSSDDGSPRSPRESDRASNDLEPLSRAAGLDRIRGLSHLLDNAIPIPGTGYSFGLDPIIGLLPAGGDIVGTVLSAYIVLEAARFRLTVPTLTRMVFNIVLEMIVGTVPLVGDLFDAGWKANVKNLRLLEAHLSQPQESRAADQKFFIVLVLILGGLVVLQIIWYVFVFRLLVALLGQ